MTTTLPTWAPASGGSAQQTCRRAPAAAGRWTAITAAGILADLLPRTHRPRRRLRRSALVLLIAVALPGVSYARALAYPGNTSYAVRIAEWVRDHNGSNVIDAFENWKYSRHPPATLGTPTREALPAATVAGAARAGGVL